ncbi:MAG: hypothetical protein R3F59_17075 [Myxococcota bacterium]
MQRREIVSATVMRPGAQLGVSLVGTLAIVALVIVGVNLWLGLDRLPAAVRGTTPLFAGVAVVLGAVTAFLWSRARRRLTLVDQGEQRVLEIDDRPPVVLAGPFTVRKAWMAVPGARGASTRLLQVAIVDGDRVPLLLTEEWGALTQPPDWPEGALGLAAERAYTAGGIRFLAQLVEALESP